MLQTPGHPRGPRSPFAANTHLGHIHVGRALPPVAATTHVGRQSSSTTWVALSEGDEFRVQLDADPGTLGRRYSTTRSTHFAGLGPRRRRQDSPVTLEEP